MTCRGAGEEVAEVNESPSALASKKSRSAADSVLVPNASEVGCLYNKSKQMSRIPS